MNLVITFSRGYGTGTSIITRELSERLGIPVYGKDYVCRQLQDPKDMRLQNDIVKKLAQKPCIIVGRGASVTLADQSNVLNIFVYADKEDRIRRIMKKEQIDRPAAEERIRTVDRERREFFQKNTGLYWGDLDRFDIILDSSKYGIENCADIIMRYLEYHEYV